MIEGSAAVQTPRTPISSALLADDPPWGNILVHQPDAAEALELQRTLRIGGYRTVGPAASKVDVERFLEGSEIDCAVIDARAGFELGSMLDMRGIPVVAVSSDVAAAVLWRASGHQLVLRPYRPGEILRAIHQAMRQKVPKAPMRRGPSA
jgi:hypothetical protein